MLYSEKFISMQGEGKYTGNPSIWLRFFLCNLNCNGFGQADPTDPSTYDLPYLTTDVSKVKHITELPVFEKGCDSSYSWSKRYRHLIEERTPEEVIQDLHGLLPDGLWTYDDERTFDMVFTGGEPMLKHNQRNMVDLLDIWLTKPVSQSPSRFTIETNGTRTISNDLVDAFSSCGPSEVFWSYSPKLFTVSGEPNKRAIKPESIIHTINEMERCGINYDYQLKFVVGPLEEQWDELEMVIDQIGLGRERVWIMPVGATVKGQNLLAGDVADMTVARGYKVSARVHAYLWENVIGK